MDGEFAYIIFDDDDMVHFISLTLDDALIALDKLVLEGYDQESIIIYKHRINKIYNDYNDNDILDVDTSIYYTNRYHVNR